MQKINLDIARGICEDFGLIPLFDECNSIYDRNLCLTKEGYFVFISIKSLERKNHKIVAVGKRNPYSQKNIEIFLNNNSLKYEVLRLFEETSNQQLQIELRCMIDGHIWVTNWGNLLKGHGCNECYLYRRKNKTQSEISDIKNRIFKACKKCNYEFIEGNILEIESYFTVRDADGYMGITRLLGLEKGYKISPFYPTNPYILENAKVWLLKNRPDILLLSDSFNKESMEFKCLICEQNFVSNWHYIRSSNNVHRGCSILERFGSYSINRAIRHEDQWTDLNSRLYIIKIYSEEEEFYKIGITKRKIQQRMRNIKKLYNIDVIREYELSLFNSCFIEDYLLDYFINDKYFPNKKFSGHTECFKSIDICVCDNAIINVNEIVKQKRTEMV